MTSFYLNYTYKEVFYFLVGGRLHFTTCRTLVPNQGLILGPGQ